MLDLAYVEDSKADVDMNVVKTGAGLYIELQGTAEALPFGREALNRLLDLADTGIRQLIALQRGLVGQYLDEVGRDRVSSSRPPIPKSSGRFGPPRWRAGDAGGVGRPAAGRGTGGNRSHFRGKRAAQGALLRQAPVARACGQPTLTVAEDSGLVIDALDGEPGVRSARFLRPTRPTRSGSPRSSGGSLSARISRARRASSARWRWCENGLVIYETTGDVEGEIAAAPSGTGGFGYDPIFYYPPYGSTLADVTQEEKLRVAHRGIAFRKLASWLQSDVA